MYTCTRVRSSLIFLQASKYEDFILKTQNLEFSCNDSLCGSLILNFSFSNPHSHTLNLELSFSNLTTTDSGTLSFEVRFSNPLPRSVSLGVLSKPDSRNPLLKSDFQNSSSSNSISRNRSSPMPENYGDRDISVVQTLENAYESIRGDQGIMLLGISQALFEAGMYIFVVMWTPTLDETSATPVSHGW
eukprot:1308180-Amorphochlora_amoeboformis.AAC.1